MNERQQLKPASRKRLGFKFNAQAMLEFALALPVLLAVVYGLIESGRAVFMYASVATAARQASRYGSATGDNGSGTLYYNDCAGIRNAAKRIGFLQTFADSDIVISYDHGPGAAVISSSCTGSVPVANGDRIVVAVSTQYYPIVPLVQFRPVTFTSASARTLLLGASIAVDPGAVGPPAAGGGSLVLDKFCTPTHYIQIGDVINYTFTLTNPGSNPVTGISIVDPTIPGFSCTGLTDPLAGGGATTGCTATYTIGAADITNGSVQNTATASGISGSTVISATDTCTSSYTPLPKLTLSKAGTAPETIAAGQPVNYTFTLLNNGNVSLIGPYAVSDSPITSVTCPSTPSPLPVGQAVTCTGYYTLKNNDISPDPLVNTATATAHYGASTITSNVATASVPVPPLFLSITADPTPVSAPGPITFTYHLHNPGTSVLRNITVTDNRGATNLACVASLAPGAADTCTHIYNVTQADIDAPAGFFVNVGSAITQNNKRSNTASVNVAITQSVGLALTKSASPNAPTPPAIEFPSPQSITYTYTLTNTGNVTLKSPFTIADDKITTVTCASADLAPAGTKTCSVIHALTGADRAAGSLTNHATATALFGTQVVTSAPATATVTTYAGPRLSLIKTANPTYYTAASSSITYSFALKNTGNVPLTVTSAYTLTDTTGATVASISCPAMSVGTVLDLGASKICDPYVYRLTGDDVSAASVTNTATASAGSTDPATASPSTSLTTPRFGCTTTSLTHGTLSKSGNNYSWPILNNTGLPVHMNSLTITWSLVGSTNLTVILDGVGIGTSTANSSGSYTVPSGPWIVDTGTKTVALQFSAAVTNVRIVASFAEPECQPPNPVLDSNVP